MLTWTRATLLAGAVATCLATAAAAHPPVGIVRDASGAVFYSDLAQVWRLAPDGTKSVAVPEVHTHELYLDAAGNLYGEHLWYEGEATDRWGHRVWVRHPDGRIEDVIKAHAGFRTDCSFVRDAAGSHYWIERSAPAELRKRVFSGAERTGPETVVATLPASIDPTTIGWMVASADGTVYFTAEHDLYTVTPAGAVRPLAANVGQTAPTRPQATGKHALMGLWLDGKGDVDVAVWGEGAVKSVSSSGKIEVIDRSTWPWGPTGGVWAPNGDLYLLETSVTNEVRVRKIPAGGGASVVY